jgi:hypothetical protein
MVMGWNVLLQQQKKDQIGLVILYYWVQLSAYDKN